MVIYLLPFSLRTANRGARGVGLCTTGAGAGAGAGAVGCDLAPSINACKALSSMSPPSSSSVK